MHSTHFSNYRENNAIIIHFFTLSYTKHDLINFFIQIQIGKKINKNLSKSVTNKIKEE
jgi:hypothetical protein